MSDTTTTTTTLDEVLDTPKTDLEKEKVTNKEFNFRALEKAKESSDKRVAELEAELNAKKEADLAEAGKYKELADVKSKRAEELESKIKEIEIESKLQSEIFKTGVNPKFAKFVQEELKKSVKNGESLENISETIKTLQTEFPEFFQAQTITGLTTGSTTGSNQRVNLSKISEMSTADYIANRDKIKDSWEGVKLG